MPSSHLILCRPLLLLPPIPPSIRVFSNESTLRMRWPKYRSFSFSIIPSKEHPGLISFRMDWLDLLAVQVTLKSLLQHHSSKSSIFQCSAFFTVQLSHPYMTTGKTIALTRQTFVGKVMSLLLTLNLQVIFGRIDIITMLNLPIHETSMFLYLLRWKKRKWKLLSCVWLFATPIQSVEFSRPEYWSEAVPFARVSSQPRDWTQVSHIASRFFTSWATREACPLMRLAASKSCLSEHSLWVSQVTCRKSFYSETFMIFTSCNKFIKINKFSSLQNLMSL